MRPPWCLEFSSGKNSRLIIRKDYLIKIFQDNVESRATQSVRVPVMNLRKADPNINLGGLQDAVGWQFLRTNIDGEDLGMEVACR